ncbi:MAG TPA: hypothetical protein VGG74_11760 [Kofleriaceae bacterium]|jgi:hypothetical protein
MADQNLFEREPIFWTTTKPGYNDADRQSSRMVDGRRVVEKFPQHGHVGDYDNPQKAPGQRFIYVITDAGHEIPMCLTNGASHLDSNGPYAQYVRRKARFLGWFPPAACPAALLQVGELDADRIVDKSILDAKPCLPDPNRNRFNPCPHSRAEKVARMKQHEADERERLANYKDNGQRLIEAQRDQTQALVEALQTAIADRESPARTAELVKAIQDAMRSPKKGEKQE